VQGLGVTQADAERLKERFGIASAPLVDPSEMVPLPSTPGQGARQASRELLSHIIHQRLDEVFQLVAREFERAGYAGGRLPAGVVLTGGTAHLPGIVELARDVFATPVRAGAPERDISGLVDSVQAPRYAVPVGLVLYGTRRIGQGQAATPLVGSGAIEENRDEVLHALQGADLVFVTCGMGGGTGTGAAPIISQVARDLGGLTIGICTKPFLFEGRKRMRQAEMGIAEMRKHVDTMIVVPNERLLAVVGKGIPFQDALKKADEVLLHATQGIASLISVTGLVN